MRKAVGGLLREPDAIEHLVHARAAGGAIAEPMRDQALGDDLADAHARVQRAHGVLEDHLHPAPQGVHVARAGLGDVGTGEADRAAGRLDEPQQRAAQRRLPAAGLANEPERLAAPDLEVDAVDRAHVADRAPHHPAPDGEVRLHAGGLQQRLAHGATLRSAGAVPGLFSFFSQRGR